MENSAPPLFFQYPPQCCQSERAAHERDGSTRFEEDYHAGWNSRASWERLVSVLRSIKAQFRTDYAKGYARAALAHAPADWSYELFVKAAVEAASAPPT
jgi:hypothetical protein